VTRYRTIVADPPWPYSGEPPKAYALHGRYTKSLSPQNGPHGRYSSMSMEDLKAMVVPVERDAHLYLWTTNAFMVEAHELATAWGFKQKTILTWVKTRRDDGQPSMKVGHYFRGATEHCLFCVRGSLRLQASVGLPTAYLWPRLPHSVKPDAFYDLVEQASPGPYIELFARSARFGWDYWGDQSLETARVAWGKTTADVG
jgi:N6-adenosine-specific RNA methylase IME4